MSPPLQTHAGSRLVKSVQPPSATLVVSPTVDTTLNFYTHAIPDTHRRAIESLEEALFLVVPKCCGCRGMVINDSERS